MTQLDHEYVKVKVSVSAQLRPLCSERMFARNHAGQSLMPKGLWPSLCREFLRASQQTKLS